MPKYNPPLTGHIFDPIKPFISLVRNHAPIDEESIAAAFKSRDAEWAATPRTKEEWDSLSEEEKTAFLAETNFKMKTGFASHWTAVILVSVLWNIVDVWLVNWRNEAKQLENPDIYDQGETAQFAAKAMGNALNRLKP